MKADVLTLAAVVFVIGLLLSTISVSSLFTRDNNELRAVPAQGSVGQQLER